MVEVGTLVKEDCSSESNARLGTIVKVTQVELDERDYQFELQNLKRVMEATGREYDPEQCDLIRPGKVFSVRWQDDPTRITVHVAYDDCNGRAQINLGSNSVRTVQ